MPSANIQARILPYQLESADVQGNVQDLVTGGVLRNGTHAFASFAYPLFPSNWAHTANTTTTFSAVVWATAPTTVSLGVHARSGGAGAWTPSTSTSQVISASDTSTPLQVAVASTDAANVQYAANVFVNDGGASGARIDVGGMQWALDAQVQRRRVATFMGQTQKVAAPASSSAFVTTWVTTAAGETITLPLAGTVNITVDWGDGSSSAITSSTSPLRIHTYATPGTQTIRITGSAFSSGLVFNNGGDRLKIRTIQSWGPFPYVLLTNAYFGCTNLTALPNLESLPATVTSMSQTFYTCSSLQTIPTALFLKCNNVTTFFRTFGGCTALKVLPDFLFGNKASATNFTETFLGCTGLTGRIPPTLFSGCTAATSYNATFSTCSNLSGAIPAGLFPSVAVTTFNRTFYLCPKLTSIPAGLFAGQSVCTNFTQTFEGCTLLAGAIPSDLFQGCSAAIFFNATFRSCQALTGSIPSTLFQQCSNATNFNRTFDGCFGLSGAIPAALFATCLSSNFFSETFTDCTGLTGGIPANLFPAKGVTNFYRTFYRCLGLTSLPSGLFNGMSQCTTFRECFFTCSALAGTIPANLFQGCSAATTYLSTFDSCINLTGAIPTGLISASTPASDFYRFFRNCNKLTSVPSDLFGALTSTTPFFSQAFTGCSGITSAVPTLWLAFPSAASTTGCFFGCTNASNYASIPLAWR